MTTPHTPTSMKISFDGFGLNGDDEYKSRIATFTKPVDEKMGRAIERAVNSHEEMIACLKNVLNQPEFKSGSKEAFYQKIDKLIDKAEGKGE